MVCLRTLIVRISGEVGGPDGAEIGEFIADGVITGNDGKNDRQLYVVNNRSLSSPKYREVKKNY